MATRKLRKLKWDVPKIKKGKGSRGIKKMTVKELYSMGRSKQLLQRGY